MYKPQWDEGFQGWTVKFVSKNLWKVESSMSFDDLMQVMKEQWCYCVRKYPHIDNQAWLMSMYRSACSCILIDLAKADSRQRAHIVYDHRISPDDEESTYSFLEQAVGDLDNYGPLLEAVEKAPEEVRAVLRLLLDSPSEVLRDVCSSWGGKGAAGVFSNKHLCALLGYDPAKVNLPKLVQQYFSTTQEN